MREEIITTISKAKNNYLTTITRRLFLIVLLGILGLKTPLHAYDTEIFVRQDETAKELLHAGVNKIKKQEFNLAYKYLLKASELAHKSDSFRIEVLAINNIGNLFYVLSDVDSALYYYYEALKLAETHEIISLQSTLNNNIGIIYSSLNQYDKAMTYYNKALKISDSLNDSYSKAISLVNTGLIKLGQGYLREAQHNLLTAKEVFLEYNDTTKIISITEGLGRIRYEQEEYSEALLYFEKALEMARQKGYKNDLPVHYLNTGKTLLSVRKYALAINYLDTACTISIENKQYEMTVKALKALLDLYKETGKLNKALGASQQIISLNDSIIESERTNMLETNRIQYEFDTKARAYDLLKKESRTRNVFWSILLSALVLIIALVYYIFRLKLKEAILKRDQLRLENEVANQILFEQLNENKELKNEIENTNYELMSKSLLIENKNKIIDIISNIVEEAGSTFSSKHHAQLRQHLLRDNIMDKNHEDFTTYFERVHVHFLKNLHKTHPNLSSNDLRLSAFLALQFTTKEIAEIFNITPESVRKRKQRLREKMNISSTNELIEHLYKFTD